MSAFLFALTAALGVAAPASALTGPQVGAPAPDFSLRTIDGKNVSLAGYRGKTLVINVWGTWCPPCRQETPDLVATAPGLMKEGVAFLGVDDTEQAPVVRAFGEAKGIPYPLAIDADKNFSDAYDIQYFPTTLVIDAQGVLRARYIDVLGSKELTALVDAARAGQNGTIESPLQTKIDATLAAAPSAFGSDPATIGANAKKAADAIDAAEDDLDQSDAASGNATDLIRTRAEEATVRSAAITALFSLETAVEDKSLLPKLNGDAAIDREDWNEALAAYAAVLEIDPKNEDALSGTAVAASRLEKYDAAIDADTKLAALHPQSSSPLVELARAQAKAGKIDDARATFAKAIALAALAVDTPPKDAPKALRALAYANLYAGRFEAANGAPERARVDYAQALAAAERLPASDERHDMYVEESQEATVALGLSGDHTAAAVSLVPWTGADLPGSIPNTIKYRLVLTGPPGHAIALATSGLPHKWVASFCSNRICAPFRVTLTIPEGGVKVVEFQLIPPGPVGKAPSVRVSGRDGAEAFSATT